MLRPSHLPIVLAALLLAPSGASAATLYVDGQLGQDCPGSYDPASRACSGGQASAYKTLQGGAAAAQAGDTVLIRGGTYQQQLAPAHSGTAGQPITFKSYNNETVTVSGVSSPALYLLNRSYITIEGLTVTSVQGWGRLESATYCVISKNTFTQATATGTTGGLKLVKSSYNRITGNTFTDGNDNVVVQESDRNLLEGNTFTKGRHSLLSVRCGNFNVIRNNHFANTDQKAAEIYDCEGVSDAPFLLDATKRNLFEGNVFSYTKGSDQSHDYNGIQYAGQDGIVRHNVFYDNLGGGLGIQVYSDEALHNNGHRIYNNTFVRNRCYGISASSDVDPAKYFDIVVKNNLLYQNTDCGGGGGQTAIGNTTAVKLTSNAIGSVSPQFVDEPGNDFHLTQGSPMIDAAAPLAKTVGAGSGTEMTVDDASYFYDGNGIAGEVGDRVQLEGKSVIVQITAIDYAQNKLTLGQALTWQDGQGVHLPYQGLAPDQGAFEFGAPPAVDGGSAGDAAVGDGAPSGDGGSAGDGQPTDGTTGGEKGATSDDGCGCHLSAEPGGGALFLVLLLLWARTMVWTRGRRSR